MIWYLMRTLGAFTAGLLTAFALIIGVELLSNVLHPFPSDFAGTEAEICLHVAKYPHWVLGVVVVAWGLAGAVGTWIARRIGNVYSAVMLAVLLLGGVGLNISMLPYPLWFKATILLVMPITLAWGVYLAASQKKKASQGI